MALGIAVTVAAVSEPRLVIVTLPGGGGGGSGGILVIVVVVAFVLFVGGTRRLPHPPSPTRHLSLMRRWKAPALSNALSTTA